MRGLTPARQPTKIPNDITIVEALPRNATGKVLKRELRTQFVAEDAPNIS